jgi:hypothetical protein
LLHVYSPAPGDSDERSPIIDLAGQVARILVLAISIAACVAVPILLLVGLL